MQPWRRPEQANRFLIFLAGCAVACCPVDGDMVAVVGVNRKLVAFPVEEVPEMSRGKV